MNYYIKKNKLNTFFYKKSILTESIKKRFGTKNYNKYFSNYHNYRFFSYQQEKELLTYFATNGYFLDNPLFDSYREKIAFQKFFGAFYSSSKLDLLLKLFLLREILKQAEIYGVEIFSKWTFFFRECYDTDLITKRNMEMETFLSLNSDFIQTITNL